jgi:hypothetical protein
MALLKMSSPAPKSQCTQTKRAQIRPIDSIKSLKQNTKLRKIQNFATHKHKLPPNQLPSLSSASADAKLSSSVEFQAKEIDNII